MTGPRIFKIRSSILGGSKPLTVDKSFIETIDYLQVPVRFEVEDIEAVRLGAEGKNFNLFALSRSWALDIRGSNHVLIRIRYYSLLGIGAKRKRREFSELINVLNDTFFNQLCLHYLSLLQNQLTFELGGALLNSEGIKLTKKSPLLPWDWLDVKRYPGSFILYDLRDQKNYQAYDFFHTWNAFILYGLIRYLLKNAREGPATITKT